MTFCMISLPRTGLLYGLIHVLESLVIPSVYVRLLTDGKNKNANNSTTLTQAVCSCQTFSECGQLYLIHLWNWTILFISLLFLLRNLIMQNQKCLFVCNRIAKVHNKLKNDMTCIFQELIAFINYDKVNVCLHFFLNIPMLNFTCDLWPIFFYDLANCSFLLTRPVLACFTVPLQSHWSRPLSNCGLNGMNDDGQHIMINIHH